MPTWQVQKWQGGKPEGGGAWQRVEAASAKEAAEQLHGGPLSEWSGGEVLPPSYLQRARSHVRPFPKGPEAWFLEP
jgi:hypothetical protein